jgi:hypothetical protein
MRNREKTLEAIRAVCCRANPDRVPSDRHIGLCDILLASQDVGRNLAIQDSGCFMELREDELEEKIGWADVSADRGVFWELRNDHLEAQSDDVIGALADLLVPGRAGS